MRPDTSMRPVRRAAGTALLFCSVMIATAGESAAAEKTPSLPGTTYSSLQRLPDWSGIWVRTRIIPKASKRDLHFDIEEAPLTPEYRKIADESAKNMKLENMGRCLPAGPAAILDHGVLHEYLFTPGRITVLYEDGEQRRIYTDGRVHLALNELRDSFMGDSIGHWEGKTLVVDTIGFPKGELFMNNVVHATLDTHMVEHITQTDPDHIEISTQITDPKIFSKPFAYTRLFKRSELPFRETDLCNTYDASGDVDLSSPPPPG